MLFAFFLCSCSRCRCANVDKQGQLCCMRAIPTEVCLASPSFDSIDAFQACVFTYVCRLYFSIVSCVSCVLQHVAAALGIIVVLGLPWAMYTQIQDAHRKVFKNAVCIDALLRLMCCIELKLFMICTMPAQVSATFLPACTEQTRAKRALELELQTIKSNSAVSNAQRRYEMCFCA